MNPDEYQLHILSIAYRVAAGILALATVMESIFVLAGMGLVNGILLKPSDDLIDRAGGWLFIIHGIICAPITGCYVLATLITASYLSSRKNYMFCKTIAYALCLLVPLGTILGAFTLVVMNRKSVKDMFYLSLR